MIAAFGLTVVPRVAPAQAAMVYQVHNYDNDGTNGVYLRKSPHLSDVSRTNAYYLTYGTSVQLVCAEFGDPVGPYGNKAWDYVKVVSGPRTGTYGHLSEHWINTPVASGQHVAGEPACTSGSATSTPTMQIAGVVHCNSGKTVQGVWVQNGAGGSRFASWLAAGYFSAASSTAAFTTTVPAPASGQTSSVQLRIGCGGNTSTWGSTNRTPYVAVHGSTLMPVTCADPGRDAGGGDAQRCTLHSVGTDSGAIHAALWALSQLHQVSSGGRTHTGRWSGYCAALVGWAWRGSKSSGYPNATAMYSAFKNAGRTPSFSTSIPIGALAFYRLSSTTEGHVNIHVGLGVFVSTKGYTTDSYPVVDYTVGQYANASHTYRGWMMPPTSWLQG